MLTKVATHSFIFDIWGQGVIIVWENITISRYDIDFSIYASWDMNLHEFSWNEYANHYSKVILL